MSISNKPKSLPRHTDSNAASPDPTRRRVLGSLLAVCTAAHIPWALAQPITDDKQGAFLALSAIIAGRKSLDTGMAQRLYQALEKQSPGFPEAAQALLKLINERNIEPEHLQKTLDAENSPLAPLPRQIATAWFMGIVGSGAEAHCLAYEHALNAQIVADALKPPTYAYGPYGSWSRKPT